jgi:hypothetical protein
MSNEDDIPLTDLDETENLFLGDIPDEKFNLWSHEGKYYHEIGLMQMWRRGYTPFGNRYDEPVITTPAFKRWIKKNNSEFAPNGILGGPPFVRFPDIETAKKFWEEMHIPGEEMSEKGVWL